MKPIVFVLFSLLFVAGAFCQKPAYGVLKKFRIASPGGWDYIAVNNGKLYVSHGTQVNILDEKTGDSAGVIPNTTGVHGIAFNNAKGRGYTSNGRLNNVTIFDLATNAILDSIKTGENPDAILFEPSSNTIITCNGRSNDLTVIDVQTEKVIATIPVGGKPETAVSDGRGTLFVNIEDKNEIAAVDLKTAAVVHHWPLHGESPTGLAIDTVTKRLFSTCEKLLVVMNATTGSIVDTLPTGDGCDGAAFDEKKKLVFTSNGEGSITVVQEKTANSFSVVGTIPTKRGARTITIDKTSGTLFLPTADFETTTGNERPKMIPGTFQVLVVQ